MPQFLQCQQLFTEPDLRSKVCWSQGAFLSRMKVGCMGLGETRIFPSWQGDRKGHLWEQSKWKQEGKLVLWWLFRVKGAKLQLLSFPNAFGWPVCAFFLFSLDESIIDFSKKWKWLKEMNIVLLIMSVKASFQNSEIDLWSQVSCVN